MPARFWGQLRNNESKIFIEGNLRTLSILSDLKMYVRFTWGLRGFLKYTLTLEEAKEIVKKRMAERETNFLRLMKKGIYGYPKSPYLPLLKLAGCEFGDIEARVRNRGLENTLQALRESGVYITFEEFKGRKPMVRNGKVFPVTAHDFDNPFLKHYYEGTSSGTTGSGTRVAMDLDHISAQAPYLMLTQNAHNLLGVPTAIWFGTPPDETGINNILRRACFRGIPNQWFSPVTGEDVPRLLKYRLVTPLIILLGKLNGVAIPWPEKVPLHQALKVARWAFESKKENGHCLIHTHVSKALRVCLAAQEAGLDLTGVTLIGGGESPTKAKIEKMTKTGATFVPTYNFAETGIVGLGCARPAGINDIHFFKDGMALIQSPRRLPGVDWRVDAFYFTSLLSSAPKLMLNVENDDYGIMRNHSCGCPLEDCGFTEHLKDIYSVQKLTGEGVTLLGNEMVTILEEILPTRFGGTPLDYQWVEEEDEQGFTRLNLFISPTIKLPDEKLVIDLVLKILRQGSEASRLTQAIWRQAETLKIKRRKPVWTARGKLMPLRSARYLNLSGGSSLDDATTDSDSFRKDD